MIRTSLILALVFLLNSSFTATRNENVIHIINLDSKPIVVGKINGKRACFLIDTGSDFTLLNEGNASVYGFQVNNRQKRYGQLVDFSGSRQAAKNIYDLELVMGKGHEFQTNFVASDLNSLVTGIQRNTGIRIAGIIGSDLMKKYGFRIDYGARKIFYKN